MRRVHASNDSRPYIFIGEERMLEYHASRKPCDLVVIKGHETEIEYHLAVRKNYDRQIVTKLEAALGKLNETGVLDALYQKWWVERSECTAARSSSSAIRSTTTAILAPFLIAVLMRFSRQ